MSITHLLPELPKGLDRSPPERPKRNKQKIPTFGAHGHCSIPDEVVAGLKWCQEQGMLWRDVRFFFPGVPQQYYDHLRQGYLRSHVLPRCPVFISEHFWKERFRWPR